MSILLILNVLCIAFSSFMVGKLSEVEGAEPLALINVLAVILNISVVLYNLN